MYFEPSLDALSLRSDVICSMKILPCVVTNIKNKLTDLCGNRLLHNNFKNTFCEMRAEFLRAGRLVPVLKHGETVVVESNDILKCAPALHT